MGKRLMLLILVQAIVGGTGLVTTASSAGEQPRVTFTPISQVDGIEFSRFNSGWGDPVKWYGMRLEEVLNMCRERGLPITKELTEDLRAVMAEQPRDALISKLGKLPYTVVFRLGIRMPEDHRIVFNGPGCLSFSLQMPDSSRVSVEDVGVICFAKRLGMGVEYDTRLRTADKTGYVPVALTARFNSEDDGSWPKVVYALLPRACLDARVLNVSFTDRAQVKPAE